MVVERDKKTRSDLDEARRLFEEAGLESEAREAGELGASLGAENPSRELLTLYQIGQTINSILELEPLLERIMDLAIETLEAERGLIILVDEQSQALEIVTARQLEKEKETLDDALVYSEGLVRQAARGESILSHDAVADPRYTAFKSVSLYDIKSFICVPLKLKERSLGTVYVDSRKPGCLFDREDLRFLEAFANQAALAIENARLMKRLRDENRMLRQVVSRQYGFDNIIGRSPEMERVFKVLSKVADGQSPIMLLGASGTGKELLSKAIHYNSSRREKPFIALNCAAVPHDLLESELFGHVRGAFSGADRDKKGLLEEAHEGTFFFDEIGEMDVTLQAKLLRAVEERAIRRVGDTRSRAIDVRFVSATNKNLKHEIAQGHFREDLYYRLNVVAVRVPALSEREGDIALLAEHFLQRARERSGRAVEGFTRAALARLQSYAWPGNVRELENAVERAFALTDGPRIDVADLPEELGGGEALADRELPSIRVESLWQALRERGATFWDVVREPFLRHELARDDVRELVRRGLTETRGSYKDLASLFHVGDQYKKFHAFLKNSGCHLGRDEFKDESSPD